MIIIASDRKSIFMGMPGYRYPLAGHIIVRAEKHVEIDEVRP